MTVQTIPISEPRQHLKDLLDIGATGTPYFITQYSWPKATLIRYDDYNALPNRR
jgi:prevent-host-death family protein